MRIVLVMDQFDDSNNGTTIAARRLAENLRQNGHTVTVLAGGRPEAGKICAKKHKIRGFQWLIESQGMCFAKPDPALYYQAFKDADVVHFFMPFRFCRMGEKHARQMQLPSVASFHVQPENITSTLFLEGSKFINGYLYRWFYRVFYNRFGLIHCPSNFIAGQLAQHGYQAEIRVISNGVASSFVPTPTVRPPQYEGKFLILMIGRLSREKRQDLLIRAVQKSRYADRIQLFFAGKGPTAKKYRRMGRRLPNPPVMDFYSQPDLLRLINTCDLYVHASDAEIEGISCMEAMACGLVPVISDSVLSATGQYALCGNSLFAAGSADDLAKKIDYWIEHPEEKAEYSKLYQRQQDQNRVDACVKQLVDLYGKAVDQAKGTPFRQVPVARWKKPFIPRAARLNSRLYARGGRAAAMAQVWSAIVAGILLPFNKLLFGLRVEGAHHLKKLEGGAVTVSNHVHDLDCTMLKTACLSHKLWLVSLRSNFEIPVAGHLIKALGAVALGTTHREMAAFQHALLDKLEKGDFVHYYPEGMLVPYHDGLRRFHPGAFTLAVRAEKPVVPVVFCPEKRRGLFRLKRKPCLRMKVLEPVWPDNRLPARRAQADLQ